ncbi:hypothetical protein ABBQ32_005213 [Trebouxia sp. C0010 RCD-2024]
MPGRLRVLNVAEKPSVSREVSNCLSGGTARRINAGHIQNYAFDYSINGQQCEMVFSAVAGHLQSLDFTDSHKKWHSCPPVDLYTAPVIKFVPEDKMDLKVNLEQQARQSDWLVLWLDCDREGENIAYEVIDVCLKVRPRLVVKRARFSALIARDLHHAVNNLVAPNQDDAKAVDARQEIDLRIGSSFTRMQTLLLQSKFDWSSQGVQDEQPMISYGPCQFPTLGLIVQRAWEIQAHVPEDFWHIQVTHTGDDRKRCEFSWDRGRLFDHTAATLLYEMCVEEPQATVTKVQGKERRRQPPVPLSTLEMQKKATQSLHMPGERIMKVAEELYQSGFISYPRTETDSFPPGMDLMAMVRDHAGDSRWGAHAHAIANGNMWKPPGNGGHDDKAHPPIHPTKHTAGESGWNSEKSRLYEFIVRSFLATCSKAAVGFETRLEIQVAGEGFSTTGLMVTERNWLEVYPYTKWGGNDSLPHLQEGQTFMPSHLMLKEGRTQPAARLSERDLIALMEQHNIGTDATVSEHIQKQLSRGYATKDASLTFWPTPLGEALVGAYRKMGLENLWLPNLRGTIEANINAVAHGTRTKESVLQEAVDFFKADFISASQKQSMLDAEVALFFNRAAGDGDEYNSDGSRAGDPIGPCHSCGLDLMLRKPEGRPTYIACMGHPSCRERVQLPRATQSVSVSQEHCQDCHHGIVHKLDIRFRQAQLPLGTPSTFCSCIICGRSLKALLDTLGHSRPPALSAAAARGRTGASRAGNRGGQRGPGLGTRRGGRSGVNHRARPRADSDDDDDDGNPRPARRARGSARAPTRGRAGARSNRGAGRSGSSNARGNNNGGGWNSSSGAPLCPNHGLECLSLTANTANNPGRKFFKCPHQTEADSCLKFAWADEYEGGSGGRGTSGAVQSRGNLSRGQGRRGSQNGGRFVSATGLFRRTNNWNVTPLIPAFVR